MNVTHDKGSVAHNYGYEATCKLATAAVIKGFKLGYENDDPFSDQEFLIPNRIFGHWVNYVLAQLTSLVGYRGPFAPRSFGSLFHVRPLANLAVIRHSQGIHEPLHPRSGNDPGFRHDLRRRASS